MDPSPGRGSLVLQAPDEVENLSGSGASVHDIPHLDEVGLFGDPMKVMVYDFQALKDLHKGFVGAVEVAYGHDLLDS